MLDAISLWVRQIVMVVMFAAFVDFLIPENKYFRYIKVFLGLLVMIAIVNPVVPLLQKDVSFNEIPLSFKDIVDKASITYKSEVLNRSNNKLTIEEYKTQIEKYLTQKITDTTFYKVKRVTTKINEDSLSDDFGRITQLLILLGKNRTENKQLKQKILIETIKIGDDKKELNSLNYCRNDEFKNIIEYLHSTFDIPKENIYIDLED